MKTCLDCFSCKCKTISKSNKQFRCKIGVWGPFLLANEEECIIKYFSNEIEICESFDDQDE